MITLNIYRNALWFEQKNESCKIYLNKVWKKESENLHEKIFKCAFSILLTFAVVFTFVGKTFLDKSITLINIKQLPGYNLSRKMYKKAFLHLKIAEELFVQSVEPCKIKQYPIWLIENSEILFNSVIPESLHSDKVLSEHICKITHSPILYPVYEEITTENGTERIYYEQYAITAWLSYRNISPITKRKLSILDLNVDFELKKKIEDRLNKLIDNANLIEVVQ